MASEQPTQPWYTQTWVAIVALVLFFPVGLYLMWRFTRWEAWVKTVVSVVISLFVILVVVSVAIGGDETDDEVVREEATPSPTVEAATPTPEPTEPIIDTAATATAEAEDAAAATATAEAAAAASTATAETAEPTVAVTYEIASREDVSFGATVRIVYRVTVSGPLTEANLRAISEEIIDDEISSQDVNAIGFAFFLPGTDTNSFYTAGKADWAPDGDWAKADTVQAGDYSSHELGAINIGSAIE